MIPRNKVEWQEFSIYTGAEIDILIAQNPVGKGSDVRQ